MTLGPLMVDVAGKALTSSVRRRHAVQPMPAANCNSSAADIKARSSAAVIALASDQIRPRVDAVGDQALGPGQETGRNLGGGQDQIDADADPCAARRSGRPLCGAVV